METSNINPKDFKRLMQDVEQIKEMLLAQREEKEMEELELTDWARGELEESRGRKTKISHEQAKNTLFVK